MFAIYAILSILAFVVGVPIIFFLFIMSFVWTKRLIDRIPIKQYQIVGYPNGVVVNTTSSQFIYLRKRRLIERDYTHNIYISHQIESVINYCEKDNYEKEDNFWDFSL